MELIIEMLFIVIIIVVLSVLAKGCFMLKYNVSVSVIAIIYIIDVLLITLLNRPPLAKRTIIMYPMYSYYSLFCHQWKGIGFYVAEALIGNVLLFVPLGMILSWTIESKYRSILIGVIGFCFSLAIEITQFIFCVGTFEIDDLIHNTWGAIIGFRFCVTIQNWKDWKYAVKMMVPVEIFIGMLGISTLFSLLFNR